MPRIPFIESEVSAGGVPDLAMRRPNAAFAELGQSAAQAESLLTQIAEQEAAIDGAAALADFKVARAKRQIELRTTTKTPETLTATALADFDEQAEKLVSAYDNPRLQVFLGERLREARTQEAIESNQWAAGALVQRRELKANEALNKFANIVNSAPSKFEEALADVDAMIDASDLPLPSADALRTKARGALSRSAVYGQVETNPAGILKELQGGKWDDYLDNDAKISAVNAAQAEIKRRASEARANEAQARAELAQDAIDLAQSDLLSRRMTGKGVDQEQMKVIRAGFTDKQWERYQSSAAKADTIFKVTGDMRSMTPAQIQATLDAAKPKGGEADFAERQAAYAEAAKIANDVFTARKNDPGAAAREAFPNVALAWQQVQANPTDPGHLRVAIKRTLAAQEAMGIPADRRKPLPAQFAAAVAGEIRGAPPDEAAKKLADYQAMFGANWKSVVGQLAPQLDSNAAVAVTLKPNTAAILLETSRVAAPGGKPGAGINDLRRTLGVKASGDQSIADIIANDDDFIDFRRAMARRGRGDTTGIAWAEATEVLALGLMQREGISYTEAAERALKETVRDKHNFGRVNAVPFATPKAIDADQVERGARTIMAQLKGDGLDLPAGVPGALSQDTRDQYLGAVRRDGYWVTRPDGLELWAGDAPVTRNGNPIRATWEVLTGTASATPGPRPMTEQERRQRFQIKGE